MTPNTCIAHNTAHATQHQNTEITGSPLSGSPSLPRSSQQARRRHGTGQGADVCSLRARSANSNSTLHSHSNVHVQPTQFSSIQVPSPTTATLRPERTNETTTERGEEGAALQPTETGRPPQYTTHYTAATATSTEPTARRARCVSSRAPRRPGRCVLILPVGRSTVQPFTLPSPSLPQRSRGRRFATIIT